MDFADPQISESATDSAKLRAIERERQRNTYNVKEANINRRYDIGRDNPAFMGDEIKMGEDLNVRHYNYEGKPSKYENSIVAKMAEMTETPKATYVNRHTFNDSDTMPPTKEAFHEQVSKRLERLQDPNPKPVDIADGPVATSTGKHSRASRPTSAKGRRSRRDSNVTDQDGNVITAEAFEFLEGYSDGEGTDFLNSGNVTPTQMRAFVAWLYFCRVSCEVYSSVANLDAAIRRIKNEDPLGKYLKKFTKKLDTQEKHLKELTTYVDQLEALSAGIREPDFDPKHPLNAYRFIRNHSVVYNETMDKLLQQVNKLEGVTFSKKVLQKVEALYPTETDYVGVLEGINRLVEYYHIDPFMVAVGELGDIKSKPLTARDCLELSHLSMGKNDLFMTRKWLEQAIAIHLVELDDSVKLEDLYHDMSITAFIAGELEVAIHYCVQRLRKMPKSRTRHARKLLRHLRFELKEGINEGEGWELKKKSKLKQRYHSLCQGRLGEYESVERKAEKDKLKCRYKKAKHPYYRFHLIKTEERSLDPYLVMFHDVISPREQTLLIIQGLPKLERATVVDDKDGKTIPSKDRVSHSIFLTQTKPVRRIMHRIAAFVSLKPTLRSFESLQLSNYGFGGMYDEHWDLFPANYFKNKNMVNQRMATFMMYLTDVEAGGATVFSQIPEVVYPKAGNALFWYNLRRNGEEDRRTMHGGCPVIVGNKWVANEWIRQWDQELTRPCALDENL